MLSSKSFCCRSTSEAFLLSILSPSRVQRPLLWMVNRRSRIGISGNIGEVFPPSFLSENGRPSRQDRREDKVIDVHKLATNEKCIINLVNDFRPQRQSSLNRTSRSCIENCSYLYRLARLYRRKLHAVGAFRSCIINFSYLYTSEVLGVGKMRLQGMKSIDRLFIQCDLSLSS
jgi:hypothetical protein